MRIAPEDREDQDHAGEAAGHRDEVERFRQRRQAQGSPRGSRRPRGLALVGLLIVLIIGYVACEALTDSDKSETAPPAPPP